MNHQHAINNNNNNNNSSNNNNNNNNIIILQGSFDLRDQLTTLYQRCVALNDSIWPYRGAGTRSRD
jgi:hypothetical protein